MQAHDTPLRRWRIARGWNQTKLGEELAKTMRALGEKVAENKHHGIWHTAIGRYESGRRMPWPVLRGLRALTELSLEALVEPERYLAKRPQALAKGQRPLSRPRQPRKHAAAKDPEVSSAVISG